MVMDNFPKGTAYLVEELANMAGITIEDMTSILKDAKIDGKVMCTVINGNEFWYKVIE